MSQPMRNDLPPSLPRAPGLKIIRREEAESWSEGYRFLEEARRAVEALTRDTERACADARARARDDGRREGGDEAARLIAETTAKVDRYLASIEQQVADLSLSLVEQVLGEMPDAQVMAKATAKALQAFRREKYVKVRVSPDVFDEVQQALAALTANAAGPTVQVEAEPRLEPRQCTIATDFAVIDASLDAQLENLRRALAPDSGSERAP